MSEFAIPKGKAPKSSSNRRLKISTVNDVLTCPLCHGYFIDPTTINNCFHSFCRSCILKHLEKYPYSNCPCCRSNKPVNLSHLRLDTQLKSIVYKLVPGLYQSERKRLQQFNDENKVVLSDHRQKLASHLNSQLINSNFHTPQQQALDSTVENNSRRTDECNDIICSGDVKIDDVDFFSADEPISLSLEYHPESIKGRDTQSVPPIRYLQCPAAVTIRHLQRFLSSKYNLNIDLPNVDIQIIYEDEVLPMGFNLMDVAYCYNWKRTEPMKFYYQILIATPNTNNPTKTITSSTSSEQVSKSVESTTNQLCEPGSTIAASPLQENSIQTKSELKHVRSVSNGSGVNSSTDRKCTQQENSKSKSEISSPPKEQKSPKTTSSWNFKSLRSNDIKCNDFVEVKNDNLKYNRSGTVTASDLLKQQKSKPNNIKDNTTKIIPETVTSSNSNNQCNNDDVFSSMKKQQQKQQDDARKSEHFKININKKIKEGNGKQYAQKNDINSPNIVVSIPQSRRLSLSDDDFENLSLATLKTANKKSKSVNLKHSVSVDESMLRGKNYHNKPDIPKLKIELSSLKAKISLNKSKSVGSEVRKSFEMDRDSIYPNQVDLTEYAKNIGLKPISRDQTEKKSDHSYQSGSSHKKRKKSGKHSREPGSSKRRKFHAEISSQEEGKLKVKITGNKLSKHERKNSSTSSSDDNNFAPTNSPSEVVEDKTQGEKDKLSELRKVRHKPTLKLNNESVTTSAAPSAITNKTNVDVESKSQLLNTNNVTSSSSHNPPSFTFAKPKSAVNDVRPKPNAVKTYLSGVKLPTKNIPSPIRPINNPRIFSPPHVPNYPNFVMPQPKNTSPINRQVNPPIKRSYSTDSPQLPKQLKLEPISRKLNIPDLIQATPVRVPPKSVESIVAKVKEPYYNSAMSSTYTHEITTKKPTPILLPPSSISVTKMSDTPKPIETTNLNNRPALEIVRISPTAPTVDQQHNQQVNEQKNQMKPSAPKATRPPPPTIPLVKIRNASNMSMNSLSAMHRKMVNNSIAASSKSKNVFAADKREDVTSKVQSSSDNIVPLDLSGRTENGSITERKLPPLSPSSSITKQQQAGIPESQKLIENITNKSHDNNNLNTIKQEIKSVDHQNFLPKSNSIKRDANFQSNNIPQSTASNAESEKKDSKPVQNKGDLTIENPKPNINTQITPAQRQLMPLPKLNEINKMRTPPVRQQNASVRNIPNPSALAFRNQVMTQKTADKQQTSSTSSSSTPSASISNSTFNSTSTIHTSNTNTSSTISQLTQTVQATSSTCAPHTAKTNVSSTTAIPNATSTSTPVVSMKSSTPSPAITTTAKISSPNLLLKQTTTLSKQSSATSSNNDVNNAKLIAAKKNLNLEKVAASLRAVASENSSANSKISTVA